MSSFDFSGQNVLITGGASGIGLEAAGIFAEYGASVIIADIDQDRLDNAIGQLDGHHVSAHCDVSDEDSVNQMVTETTKDLGQINVLINCAGVADAFLPTTKQSKQSWQRVIDINLTGTYLTCRAVAPGMLKHRNGVIINVSSIAGLAGMPNRNAYTASKHGVAGITKSLSSEWSSGGIRVIAIAPGYVKTPMVAELIDKGKLNEETISQRTPMGRLATPTEIGNVMTFLASPLASYITGTVISVDGGYIGHGGAEPITDIN
ncbi:MAG: SDR family NAD(P)-dependent oxidoreductase [Pseudomonadota bacterium]|nr:SDR family NAD(P)-dependent oxidoreductase [Pseudomonadota bacterium]